MIGYPVKTQYHSPTHDKLRNCYMAVGINRERIVNLIWDTQDWDNKKSELIEDDPHDINWRICDEVLETEN
jgi:hypothetical protein